MKKCPKCGTILDDSKIKCYVCGTDLQRQTLTNFGNSFNENIGATVSNNQGNVLSNNAAMNASNINQVNGSFSAGSNFSNSLYNSQLNNLNSMAYDDRTALEKMFSSDERFKSKAEINAQAAMRNNQRRNSFAAAFDSSFNTNNQQNNKQVNNTPNKMNNQLGNTQQMNRMQGNQQMMNQQQPMQQQMPYNNQNQMNPYNNQNNNQNQPQMFAQRMMQNKQNVQKGPSFIDKIKEKVNGITAKMKNKKNQVTQPSPINQVLMNPNPNQPVQNTQQINVAAPDKKQAEKKDKPAINWGNDLVKDKNKEGAGFKGLKMNMIFNIVALIISIVGVLFVYFKFIRNDDSGRVVTFNGLRYSISNTFILKEDKNNYRMYTHGEYCSIGISYGSTNAVATYIDDLYEKTKKDFDANNFKVSKSTAKYNDNVWTEIDVISLANNAASANGYTTQTKIQYVAIIYEGNYYKIGYQNTNNDTICSAAYSTFLKTLAFK